MADIPKLPGFIRRRVEEAINWKPAPGSMTLGDGKVRVLGADLSYLLRLIDAHEAAALPQQPTPSPIEQEPKASVAYIEVTPMGIDHGLTADAYKLAPGIYRLYATPSEAVQGNEKQE